MVAPTTSATTPPLRLARLVLTADLGEPAASWDLVTRLAFGSGRGQLGLEDDPARTPIPHFAPSFAVAPDRSMWLLDEVNRRVVHVAASGAYLGEVGGISFDRFHPHVQDIAFFGSDLVMLQVDQIVE